MDNTFMYLHLSRKNGSLLANSNMENAVKTDLKVITYKNTKTHIALFFSVRKKEARIK